MFHILYVTLQVLLIRTCDVGRVTIDMVPDVALLEIFDCYVNQARDEEEEDEDDDKRSLTIQAWHTLVHVCRKWRTIVLWSPRRLGLRLFCKDTTPAKDTLAIWPPLPIVIGQHHLARGMDNIIAALEHNDRVCDIRLSHVTNPELEEVLEVMRQPFLALTHLEMVSDPHFKSEGELLETPVVPESFLGGSAPRLQELWFGHFPFPGLPKLLLSVTGLVTLHLFDIPHSGYISPDAMVRCLSTMTRLKELSLDFESPLSRPVRRPHPHTRSILLALTHIWFQGVSEYLEDLVAGIDAPLLDFFHIKFFHQLIFDTPQLAQFIARTPNTQPPVEARIFFSDHSVEVRSPRIFPTHFSLVISCGQSDWQLSSLTQVCNSSFPEAFIPMVEHLYICENKSLIMELRWQDDIEDSQWLDVLHPFTAVKYLYLSREFASSMAPALQKLAEEVLPSLQNLFLEDLQASGPVQGDIGKFVAARQLASHPIAVSHWDRNQHEW
jgi:hypothetical protein